MADKKKKVEKDPGRIKQLWQVLNLTRKTDKLLVPILILTFLAPLGAGITVALLLSGGSVLTLILYIVTGLRTWQASEFPVAVNPRTQEAVYRAVGKPGVVLIAEGSQTKIKKMLEDERRSVLRAIPEIPVHFIPVGTDANSTPLYKLRSFKNTLRKAEVLAVSHRLTSLSKGNTMPIPKGMDPSKVRAPKPR